MHYLALASDYDGTLAKDGVVDDRTVAALERVVSSGRRVLLVTGRLVDDLRHVFPRLDLFACVVAENGGVLYWPARESEIPLGEAPPQQFIQQLRRRGVDPIVIGRVIVATSHPHETAVLEAIREVGIERQIILNKGSVMALPTGLNKATGLSAALRELRISPHNVVAVGDAENDHSFLSLCECAVAVGNALPSLKQQADYVTKGERGAGVVELIDQLLQNDLANIVLHPALHSSTAAIEPRNTMSA